MNIKRFKIKNLQRYITVLCAVGIAITCDLSLIKSIYLVYSDSFKLIETVSISFLALPVLIVINMFFDGFVIKYKFNIILGELWLGILFYLSCMFYHVGLSWHTYTTWYYLSAIFGAIVMFMPFTVRACDNTGLVRVKKHDFIWIIILTVMIVSFLVRIYLIRYIDGITFGENLYMLF